MNGSVSMTLVLSNVNLLQAWFKVKFNLGVSSHNERFHNEINFIILLVPRDRPKNVHVFLCKW
ncbi:hypothetical protein JWG39_11370 [Desulforhopalus vacuolatus]|uniref:hypothetical protein n=1 Tax=Desulforhopalus vacuolatus TaxID=40414 RepID=UPI0019666D14|nr:hypothetical protein [Desulforhopalus vacuolatus]MBM9520412.1 hypothetical protein [Desulforhopalus vacuolatus]